MNMRWEQEKSVIAQTLLNTGLEPFLPTMPNCLPNWNLLRVVAGMHR
jgi:hypothetical protein